MTSPAVRVAQDLGRILELAPELHEVAEVDKSDAPDIPGGEALLALAPVANLEAWENQYQGIEAYNATVDPAKRRDLSHILDEDDADEPPLQILTYWSEQWRQALDADYGTTATLEREAAFLKSQLDWATANEPHWDRFAKDVRKALRNLENILRDGIRYEHSTLKVLCLTCDTLVVRRMFVCENHTVDGPTGGRCPDKCPTPNGYEDEWWCSGCREHLTTDQYNNAWGESVKRRQAQRLGALLD